MDHAGGDVDAEEARWAASAPQFSPRPRRRVSRGAKIGWIVALVLVVAIGGVWAAMHIAASRGFDQAAAALAGQVAEADEASAALGTATDAAADAVSVAQAIGEASSTAEDLVDAAARTQLADAAAASAIAVETGQSQLDDAVRAEKVEKPLWTWELLSETPRLDADAAALGDYAEALDASQVEIETAEAALLAAAQNLYASVPASAAALEQANISARSLVLLDLRDAADAAATQKALGSGAASAFAEYASAAANLKLSAQAELDEKAGPLLATRLEIEQYARSIAGGVVLDFDWAPIVAGTGGSEGMGGTATWNVVRGGFSTITLSHSVAENWPSADAVALVAHEVGHAITSKCSDMFDSESAEANEAWATAWAISMGHTALGNGVQAYGYPPETLIETAATCR